MPKASKDVTLSGHIKAGHWEGNTYVIDEFEVKAVSMTRGAFEKWKHGMFEGRKAAHVLATQNAISAYSEGKTLAEYLAERSEGDGSAGAVREAGAHSDGAADTL